MRVLAPSAARSTRSTEAAAVIASAAAFGMMPSFACALEESLAESLRAGDPPIVGVVRDGRFLLDCLTLTDDEADEVATAVLACR